MTATMIPAALAHRATLSRAEVAETLGRSTDFVDALIVDGTLKATRVHQTVFVIAASVWSMLGIGGSEAPPLSPMAESIMRKIA